MTPTEAVSLLVGVNNQCRHWVLTPTKANIIWVGVDTQCQHWVSTPTWKKMPSGDLSIFCQGICKQNIRRHYFDCKKSDSSSSCFTPTFHSCVSFLFLSQQAAANKRNFTRDWHSSPHISLDQGTSIHSAKIYMKVFDILTFFRLDLNVFDGLFDII